MSFSDILKRPLPSQSLYTESDDESVFDDPNAIKKQLDKEVSEDVDDYGTSSYDDDFDSYSSDDSDNLSYDDECGDSDYSDDYEYDEGESCSNCEEDVDLDEDDIDDIADELEDIDLDDLSDEELSQMEDELENQEIDNIVGEPEEVDLDPEEEKVADDLMAVSATTELINSELNAEERAQFYESARDTQIAVYEGFLLESDIQDGREVDDDFFTEAKMWRKTMVRFSKDDRKKQLYSVAVNVSARAHNDPLYFKYQKILKARKLYKRKLEKKYHAEAIKRMKVYFNRLKNSKSSVLSNIGKKFSK